MLSFNACVTAKWWKYKNPHGQDSEMSESSFKARFVAHFLINSQTNEKTVGAAHRKQLLISQEKWLWSRRIQIRERWRYSQSSVSIKQPRGRSAATNTPILPPRTVWRERKGARHRARLISVWPSDVQNNVTIQPPWVCRGGSQNSKLWSVCLPVTPENHTSFNTFNNDSKAAQQDSQLTHERRKHSVCVQ